MGYNESEDSTAAAVAWNQAFNFTPTFQDSIYANRTNVAVLPKCSYMQRRSRSPTIAFGRAYCGAQGLDEFEQQRIVCQRTLSSM
jgi:hypothetical protein